MTASSSAGSRSRATRTLPATTSPTSAGHRRLGIGRALLEQAATWAREVGVSKLELHVFPWNEPAIALYEQFGFEREGLRKAHYRRGDEYVDAILMALSL